MTKLYFNYNLMMTKHFTLQIEIENMNNLYFILF